MEDVKLKTKTLPEWMTTVTPFTKTLALVMYFVFPIIGFYLGIQYQKNLPIFETDSKKITMIPNTSPHPQIKLSPTTAILDECHENDKFYVIIDKLTGNFLIKYKSEINQKFSCVYSKNENDYEILNKGADWYENLYNNFLFIDSGTGPPPREITIFDLSKRQLIFSDSYNTPINVENGHFDYWKETSVKATSENCPRKVSWESGGLGTAIEEHLRFNLTSQQKSYLNETRCSPRQ